MVKSNQLECSKSLISYLSTKPSTYSPVSLTKIFPSLFFRSRTCQVPVHNILFLKTHYSGSDVITNILNRFADLRELLVALPNNGLSSFYWPSKFHWRYMDMRRLRGNLPQVLCNHARYNPDVMGKFMQFNTHYVTILRNPVHHFMTVFKKLDISERMHTTVSLNPLETFVLNPKRYLNEAIQQKRFFVSNEQTHILSIIV